MCAKLLNTIAESVHSKGDGGDATRILRCMFVSSLEKLMAITDAYERLKASHLKGKGKAKGKDSAQEGDVSMEEAVAGLHVYGWRDIEQAMPIHAVAYASDSLEAFCRGTL